MCKTICESVQRQILRFGADAGAADDVYGLVNVAGFHNFAIGGFFKPGDAAQIQVIQTKDALGTDAKPLSDLIDLSTKTLDADQVGEWLVDLKASCLDECYTHIGVHLIAPDVSGDIVFTGYNASV